VNFSQSMKKSITGLVILAVALSVTWAPTHAAMVSTEEILNQCQTDRDRLSMVLERSEVRAALEAWGVSSDEAAARIEILTDQEVVQLADQLDQMPAGGSALGILVGAALFVFLVLLITDILGYTDVFPFADKAD
jgi:hypothetical protein